VIAVTLQKSKSLERRWRSRVKQGFRRMQWMLWVIGFAFAASSTRAEDAAEHPNAPLMRHPGHDPSMMGADPVGSKLFPPELIMNHQQELGIDQQQRDAIAKEVEQAHSQIFPMQWKMSAAAEALSKELDAPKIDESKALGLASKVMAIEQEVKRAHLSLLIRIRNLLTDGQRAKLAELRPKAPQAPPGH
jgi:Spy/CpxP family protein refolding chaperone